MRPSEHPLASVEGIPLTQLGTSSSKDPHWPSEGDLTSRQPSSEANNPLKKSSTTKAIAKLSPESIPPLKSAVEQLYLAIWRLNGPYS